MKDFRITGEDPEPTPNTVRPIKPKGAWIGKYHVTEFNVKTGNITYDAIREEAEVMTNNEAIVVLKKTLSDYWCGFTNEEFVKAIKLAIKALEKEAKREDREAKRRAEKEKIEALAIVYKDLKEGDLFRITTNLMDKRIYRRDKDGSTQINDINGNPCNYKSYPYLTMKVYKLSEANNEN